MRKILALSLILLAVMLSINVAATETEETMKISDIQPANAAEVLERTEPLVYTSPSGDTLNYRIYRSPAYTTDGDKAVLIVFLHGSGEKGTDNAAQLKGQSTYINFLVSSDAEEALKGVPYVIIAPQCPRGEIGPDNPVGYQWVNTPYSQVTYNLAETPISKPLSLVEELIDSMVANENCDGDNIVLSGISMGGFGAWDLALRRPDIVKSLVPICGGGDPTYAKRIADKRIWVFHCEGDKSVPVDCSRDMVLALEAAGCDVKYTEFEIDGHNAWWPAATEVKDPTLIEWIFDGVDYKITKSDTAGGTVNISAEAVKRGEPLTVIATPGDGYVLASLKINGESVTPDESGSYTLEAVTAHSNVEAVFEIESANEESAENGTAAAKDRKKSALPWIIGAGAILASIAAFVAINRKKKK